MATTRSPRIKARVAIEEEARILCVLHARPDQEPFWCLPGGNIDLGESLAAGARRELREEVGIEVELDGAILIVDGPAIGNEQGAVEVIFRGRIEHGTAALRTNTGDPHLAEARWFARDELPITLRPTTLRALLLSSDALSELPIIPIGDWTP